MHAPFGPIGFGRTEASLEVMEQGVTPLQICLADATKMLGEAPGRNELCKDDLVEPGVSQVDERLDLRLSAAKHGLGAPQG